jgi:CheY-like chemotaxis protein
MSEAMPVTPLLDAPVKHTPTVYFIDDSATMREVIKIAFRRESIHVITCSDAASALAQFDQNPPDAVITDVIMPDQDGYSVCTQIKQHAQFGHIPVILMSGVVNKSVADKAVSVHADELIRKPFQPQELIGRVKALLGPKTPATSSTDRPSSPGASYAPSAPNASNILTSLFAPPPPPPSAPAHSPMPPSASEQRPAESVWPRALADAFTARPVSPSSGVGAGLQPGQPGRPPASNADMQKLRGEIARLELLVKKLQTELQIERQYNQALELQIHTLIHSE